jgi:hypothetical protein
MTGNTIIQILINFSAETLLEANSFFFKFFIDCLGKEKNNNWRTQYDD